MRFAYPRRSSLTVPLTSDRFLAKAHLRGADAITLDLEDGVDAAHKDAARARLPEAVAMVGRNGTPVGVRINRPLDLAVRDLEAAVIPGVAYVAVAKAESAEHIRLLSELIGRLEAARGLPPLSVGMTAAVESARALQRAGEIAAADPRLFAIGLGAEDFCADCGMLPVAEALAVPKQMVAIAAHAAGIEAYGFVGTVADYTDLDGLRRAVRRARALGFSGASAIHPDQIPVLNEGFAPTADEVARARRIVAASEAAAADGRGAYAVDGAMVDRPVVERARSLLARADLVASRAAPPS